MEAPEYLQEFRLAGKVFQLSFPLFKIRKHRADLTPEFFRMVEDETVGKFMDNDIFDQSVTALEQTPAVTDVSGSGAASPASGGTADQHFAVRYAESGGDLFSSLGENGSGSFPVNFYQAVFYGISVTCRNEHFLTVEEVAAAAEFYRNFIAEEIYRHPLLPGVTDAFLGIGSCLQFFYQFRVAPDDHLCRIARKSDRRKKLYCSIIIYFDGRVFAARRNGKNIINGHFPDNV